MGGRYGEMAQKVHPGFYDLKMSHLSKKHMIEILSHFEIEPSRFLMHMTSRETCLIR